MKIISKHTYGSPDLSNYLLEKQYDRIKFAGVMTHICVLCNVIIAMASLPEAEIIVDAACVASNDEALHEKALDIMQALKIHVLNR